MATTTGFAGLGQVILTSQRRQTLITVAAHLNHALADLGEHYFITCAAEGKTLFTVHRYKEMLARLVRWAEDSTIQDHSVDLAGE